MGAQTVTIVSANEETLDDLKQYLERAGLSASGVRQMENVAGRVASVLVLFPDDFAFDVVVAEVARMRAEHKVLIVTREPLRFGSFATDTNVAVIAKPAWGWSILEAIRAFAAD